MECYILLPATFFTIFIAASVVKFLKNSIYTFNCRKTRKKEKKSKRDMVHEIILYFISRLRDTAIVRYCHRCACRMLLQNLGNWMAALKTFAQSQNAAREGSKLPFKPVEEPIALTSEVFERVNGPVSIWNTSKSNLCFVRHEVQLPIDHMDKICRD